MPPKPSKPRPSWAAPLQARLKELRMTQDRLADQTNQVIYTRLLQRILQGTKTPESLDAEEVIALALALEWSPEEMWLALGRNPAENVPDGDQFMARHAVEWDPSWKLPVLGTVAGGSAGSVESATGETIGVDPALLRGHRRENLYALKVNGNSMVTEGARADGIRHGTIVIVDADMAPMHGQVTVSYICELDLSVLKLYQEGADTVLVSLNPRGPAFRASQYELEHKGVVVLKISK